MLSHNVQRVVTLSDSHTWEVVSDRVSFIRQTFKCPGKGGRLFKIKVIYVGCESSWEAVELRRLLMDRVNFSRSIIRKSERSPDWSHELKLQGDFESTDVEQVIGCEGYV